MGTKGGIMKTLYDFDSAFEKLDQTSLEAANMEANKELKDKMIALWIDWLKQDATKGGD